MREAKQRLLEVQEVLADREFGIGRFYYLRESYPASIARLQSLVDKYPLYSRADEALYLLGQNYEGQIARIRNAPTCDVHGQPRGCAREADKARYVEELQKKASEAYDQDFHALSDDGSFGRCPEAFGGFAPTGAAPDEGRGEPEQGRNRQPRRDHDGAAN